MHLFTVLHDPRIFRFYLIVPAYLVVGFLTCTYFTGRPPLAGESWPFIVISNLLLLPLAMYGMNYAKRYGRFLATGQYMWFFCTFVCYIGGFLLPFGSPR